MKMTDREMAIDEYEDDYDDEEYEDEESEQIVSECWCGPRKVRGCPVHDLSVRYEMQRRGYKLPPIFLDEAIGRRDDF